MKRLIRENTTLTGKIEGEIFSRALLQYRNTKDHDTGMSPAKSLFGRELRDFIPRHGGCLVPEFWQTHSKDREEALETRTCT